MLGLLVRFVLRLALWASGGLLAFIVVSVLTQVYQANMAYLDFKRKSKGLFVAKDRSWLCNHTVSWGLRKNALNEAFNDYKQHGQRNYAVLIRDQFGVTTLDPNVMARIVLDEPNKNLKRAKVDGPASEFMEDSIMLAEGDQWSRLRRAVGPALRSSKFKTPNVLREIDTSINLLIEAIENKLAAREGTEPTESATIESDDLLHRFMLDLVFKSFYKQGNMIDFNAEHCRWTELVDEFLISPMNNYLVMLAFSIHLLQKPIDWLILNFHRQGKWRAMLINFIRDQTKLSLMARIELKELKARTGGAKVNEDDFVLKDGRRFQRNMADYMTDHLLDGKITQREYFNTSGFLILAADKTTTDALVHTLYCISSKPLVQEKLRESVQREGVDSVYLDWVLKESLRLMPPAPTSCGRTVNEDMELENGKRIPAGTFVGYPNYIIHRLPEYWGPDAEEFRPERFEQANKFHPLQYVPFGAGARVCPGREFATFVIKRLLVELLVRYRFHCEPKDDAYVFDSPFLIYVLYNSPTYIKITRV